MAYTLEQIMEAPGKVENSGNMVADLQTLITCVRQLESEPRENLNLSQLCSSISIFFRSC
jgi:hypothetical protein